MRPTIKKLNETDDPELIGGLLLSEDGQGNQLWSFIGGKVANRFEAEDGRWWDNDIEGWEYPEGFEVDDE